MDGAIGRYIGPGEVQQSDAWGMARLRLDLDRTPDPALGLISVTAGQSWTYQAWSRDTNPGLTSKFSSAVTTLFQWGYVRRRAESKHHPPVKHLFLTAAMAVLCTGLLWFLWGQVPGGMDPGTVVPPVAPELIQGQEDRGPLVAVAAGDNLVERVPMRVSNPATPRAPRDLAHQTYRGYAHDGPEKGPCDLFLEARWAGSLEPAHSYFKLYRLDAPGNRFFGRGDQLQFFGSVSKDGTWVRGLPADEYRVVCWAASGAAEDPPAFTVGGAETRHLLTIDAPERRRAHVLVYRADGTLAPRGTTLGGHSFDFPAAEPKIPWLQERPPLTDLRPAPGGGRGSGGGGSFSRTQGPDGFRVGDAVAVRRAERPAPIAIVKVPESSEVSVEMSFDGRASGTWVGLTVPMKTVAASLELPSGPVISLESVDLELTCRARRIEELPAVDPWAHVEIEVRAKSVGCMPLQFTWKPADGPMPVRTFLSLR